MQEARSRTQRRKDLQERLDRVRQAARRKTGERLTALWHHVYDVDRLRESYFALRRKATPGVDGMTWSAYGKDLEAKLQDLSGRLQRGAYRARPVRRVTIPKPDGRKRLIGIPALEDKIVQRATAEVLGAVYEAEMLGFSYGFRPGRGAHQALDAVSYAIQRKKVSWVLDADIRGFFDAIDHGWLVKMIEHRIADRRVVRHIKKWLRAGVLEDGEKRYVESGTPQGGSISPLLGNLYLHYAFDLWVEQWRRGQARGEVIVVRYADDILVGFQYREDGERFRRELQERLQRFGLELNAEKTRLIEFGRFAAQTRKQRGAGKPETFDFLGFTHYCGKTREGRFVVRLKSRTKRVRSKCKQVKHELRRRLHDPLPQVGAWLQQVLRGHYQYYGVPGNTRAMSNFRYQVLRLWHRSLQRRSHKARVLWPRMALLARRWLPYPAVIHPYPAARFARWTRGRSPVR
jgi:group II intron reverse transcriptase/maturase